MQINIKRKSGGGGSTKLIDLGTATSFDIKTLAPKVDYTKLTIDNFFIGSSEEAQYSGWGCGTYADRSSGDCHIKLVKSYDASTGVLSCYNYYRGYYADSNGSGFNVSWNRNCHVYLIVNPKIQ